MSTADPLDAIPQALRDAMLDPERRDQSVVVDGAEVRVEYDPQPGVIQRIHVSEGARAMTVTSFDAAAERPAAYPANVPHLPGHKASVNAAAATPEVAWAVTWWAIDDMEAALGEIRAQGAADGWIQEDESSILPGMRVINFVHPDGRQRMVQATAVGDTSTISLFDNPDE